MIEFNYIDTYKLFYSMSVIGNFIVNSDLQFPMKLDDEIWSNSVQLDEGTYLYRFLCNGEFSINDPQANDYMIDDEGDIWSVLYVNPHNVNDERSKNYTVSITERELISNNPSLNQTSHVRDVFYLDLEQVITAKFTITNITGIHAVTLLWVSEDRQFIYPSDVNIFEQENFEDLLEVKFNLDISELQTGKWSGVLLVDGGQVFSFDFLVEYYENISLDVFL